MDTSQFTENKTGELVKITDMIGENWAFVPHDLPQNLELSNKIWSLLVTAFHHIGALNSAGRYLDSRLLMTPLRRREAQLSSRLEGTITNPAQQLLFDYEDISETRRTPSEFVEVANYRAALNYYDEQNDLPISLRLICDLHRILLTDVRGENKDPGKFRRLPVSVGENYIPPPPGRFEPALYAMEEFIHSTKDIHPLIQAFLVHYQFEAIHPFQDGNGRIGRILLAIMIAETCNMPEIWLYMSPYFEANKEEYITRLFNISANGEWEQWLEFCLKGVIQQAKDTEERCGRLVELTKTFHELIGKVGGDERLHRIVDILVASPIVRTSRLSRAQGVAYSTAKRDIDKLVEAGILVELDTLSQKTFISLEIFELIYDEEIQMSSE